MPYKYRRYRRRRTKPRKMTVSKLNRKVNRIVKENRPELKFADDSQTNADIWTTAQSVNLTAIGAGTGPSQRVGDKINLKSFQMRGKVALTVNDGSASVAQARIVLVRMNFNEQAESNAAWNDVFTSESINALRAIGSLNPNRYTVLWDRIFSFTNDGAASQRRQKQFQIYKKLKHECEFDSTATIAMKGGLWLIYLSTVGQTAGDLTTEWRVRYTDA